MACYSYKERYNFVECDDCTAVVSPPSSEPSITVTATLEENNFESVEEVLQSLKAEEDELPQSSDCLALESNPPRDRKINAAHEGEHSTSAKKVTEKAKLEAGKSQQKFNYPSSVSSCPAPINVSLAPQTLKIPPKWNTPIAHFHPVYYLPPMTQYPRMPVNNLPNWKAPNFPPRAVFGPAPTKVVVVHPQTVRYPPVPVNPPKSVFYCATHGNFFQRTQHCPNIVCDNVKQFNPSYCRIYIRVSRKVNVPQQPNIPQNFCPNFVCSCRLRGNAAYTPPQK